MAKERLSPLLVTWIAWLIVASGSLAAGLTGQTVKSLLTESGIKGGLIVHVGCSDGKSTAVLRSDGSFVVHGLDADPNNVAAARQRVYDLGMYGMVSIAK